MKYLEHKVKGKALSRMGLRKALKRWTRSKGQKTEEAASSEGSVKSRSEGGSACVRGDVEDVFKKFDANGDGKISWMELRSIMRSLGHNASDEELGIIFKEADRDGDGFIDLQEFIALNLMGDDDHDQKHLRDAFKIFDLDGNGSISCEELHEVLKKLGEPSSMEDCREMIRRVDSDGNGLVDFEEFRIMMTSSSAPYS